MSFHDLYKRGDARVPKLKYDKSEHERWLRALTNPSQELTEWEDDFIAEMDAVLRNGGALTRGQESKLEDIYAEKTD